MPLSLSHLAEDIVAAMANERRVAFIQAVGLGADTSPEFIESIPILATCEAQFDPVADRSFDGACRVDVVVRVRPGFAAAFELKLGTNRLTRARVDEEWLPPCTPSHQDRRWKGNVMAVLERRFAGTTVERLVVSADGERLELITPWYVIARRKVLNGWKRAPPQFSGAVRQVAFEDIVAGFGDPQAFNELIRRLLKIDYYDQWVAHDPDAG